MENNNKKRIYRVEHASIRRHQNASYRIGPFTYLNSIFAIENNKKLRTENVIHLKDIVSYNDSAYTRLYNRFMNFEKYKSLKRVPACFSLKRPGPNEDPLLREPFSKISKEDKTSGKFPFCFDSIESLKKWFCCPHENKMLRRNGFVITEYRIPAKNIITGYHQSVFIDCPDNKPIGSISLF